jgi:hypothetical protein
MRRFKVIKELWALLQNAQFILFLKTPFLSRKKPASSGTTLNSCRAEGKDEMNTLYMAFKSNF